MSFQIFQAGDLAGAETFAEFLEGPAASEEETDQALALFETFLAVAQESHEDLEALLKGRHSALHPQARREFSRHIAKWVRGNGRAIGRTLDAMRRRFVSEDRSTFYVPRPTFRPPQPRLLEVGAQVFSSGPPAKPKTAAQRLESGAVRMMTGGPTMRLSHQLRQTLELSQSLELQQVLTLRMSLNTVGHYYGSLFHASKKLRVEIPDLGLDFEVGLISRFDLPKTIMFGNAGVCGYGYPFVVEDYFVDLPEAQRDLFFKLVAVHEYGESIFGNHHLASLLELAVAGHWGVLEPYLEFYEKRYSAKFRDVALHRLKPVLIKGLRKAGFKIPKGSEEEEWHPDLKSAEALHAKTVIDRYPVPEAVRVRFESAVRDDMKISKEELEGWIAYVTVLEQTRSFYEKALQEVEEALAQSSGDDALRLRMALFRSLSVLQHEINEGILDGKKLPEDLKDHLFTQFIERLREVVADDPILTADRKTFEKLAELDAGLWSSLGLELLIIPPETWRKRKEIKEGDRKLAEVREEQGKIQALREAAWRYALSRGSTLEDQRKGLETYEKGIREFEMLVSHPLNEQIGNHQKRWDSKKRPAYFFDRGEYLANFRARLWEDFQKEALIKKILEAFPFMAGLINAKANEAFPDLQFDVTQWPVRHPELVASLLHENVAQLEYLTAIYPKADTATQGKIRKEMARLVSGTPEKTFHFIEEAKKSGLFSEALAVEIAREVLLKDAGFYAIVLMPKVGQLPYQLVKEGGDLEKVVHAYRAVFHRNVLARGGERLAAVLKTTPAFWKECREKFAKDVAPIFDLARVYSKVLPVLARALAGQTAEGLWRRINWQGESEGIITHHDDLYSKQTDVDRLYPLQRYLKPYEFPPRLEEAVKLERMDDPEALKRLEAWVRWTLLRFFGQHGDPDKPLFLDFEFAQLQLDLHAEWIRRGLVQRLSEKFGATPEEATAQLTDFRIDLQALWQHHALLPEDIRPSFLKVKAMYVRFLADMAEFIFSPSEEKAAALVRSWGVKPPEGDWSSYPEAGQTFQSITLYLKKEGYDRFGTLSRQEREEWVQRISNRAAVPVKELDYKKLATHWAIAIENLTANDDIQSAKELLLELFRDVLSLHDETSKAHRKKCHPVRETPWLARQAWVLLSIRGGETFENMEDLFARMPKDMVRVPFKTFRRELPAGSILDPRRTDFARQIRAHFAQQKRGK